MRALFVLIMALYLMICFASGISLADDKNLPDATWHSQVKVVSQGAVNLDVAFDFANGISIAQAFKVFSGALDVLTGNFFNRPNKQLATMLIVDGVYYHKSTGIKNRAVLAQEFAELGGKIVITTEKRALKNRNRYRIAIEAGPFLIADGKDFNDWDVADPTFYRPTYRVGVGLMQDGRFFWLKFYGTLQEFRIFARQSLNGSGQIKHLMCLDGGSSVKPNAYLPTRLIILPR